MLIWQRYLLKKMGLATGVLLLGIFFVYVLIDLSIHGVRFFSKENFRALDFVLYYLRSFALHLNLFSPLAFLLALLHVLFDLGSHLELTALRVAGISAKRLLAPFAWVACLLIVVSYANAEWLTPTFPLSRKTQRKMEGDHLQSVVLNDGSKLVYQQFDSTTKELFDVFWVKTGSEIWHMKTLSVAVWPPAGRFVDHLVRGQVLEKTESFDERVFGELPLERDALTRVFIPLERRAISALWGKPEGAPQLHYKLALPLLPLAVLWCVAPFAIRFSRRLPTFLILAASLGGFVVVKTVFESLLIVSESRGLVTPHVVWAPLGVLAAFGWRKIASTL